jgi:hypothetical protein
LRSKFLATLLATLLISVGFTSVAQAASTATVNWANTLSTGSSGVVQIVGTGIDSSGNIYAAGYANGAFVDGGTTYTPAGGYDIVLVKYNSAGVKQWLKLFGSAGTDQAYRMTVSPTGTSYITGQFCGSVTVAPLSAVTPGATCDGMLIAVNTSGNGVYFQKFTGAASVYSSGVRTDANNNTFVVVGTDSMSAASTGGGTGLTFTLEGGVDFAGTALYKFNSTGTPVWVKPFAKGSGFYGNSIALDGNGDIIVGGAFSGTVTFDSLGSFTSSGNDGYVARIPANGGAYSIVKVLGGAGNGNTSGIGVTSDGSVVAMAEVTGANVLNSVTYTSLGSSDDLVFKLSGPTWTTTWTTAVASTASEAMISLVVDADNRVYVSGGSRGNINFGAAGTSTAYSGTGFDGYMVGIEADGTFAWYKQFVATNVLGTNTFNAGLSVSGNTVVGGGYFTYSQTYGDGVTATVTNTANSGQVVKVTTSAAPVVVSNSNSSSTPPPPPPITLDNVSTADLAIEPGSNLLNLQGSNLDSILSVSIDETPATIESKTESKLEIKLPELDRGYHDMTLTGFRFRITYVDAIYIKESRTVNLGALSTLAKRLKSATQSLREAVNQNWRSLESPVCQLEINNKTSATALKRYKKSVIDVCSQLTWRFKVEVIRTSIKNPIAVVRLKG